MSSYMVEGPTTIQRPTAASHGHLEESSSASRIPNATNTRKEVVSFTEAKDIPAYKCKADEIGKSRPLKRTNFRL